MVEAKHDLAIVGAGVGGCALAAQLRRLGWEGSITLLEIGRGPGGRSATRRSRRDPGLAINHGAPLFNICGEPAPALLAPLAQAGWIAPFSGAVRGIDGDGAIGAAGDDAFLRGALWRGNGGMEQICRGLLALAAAAAGPTNLRFSTLVRQLEPQGSATATATATATSPATTGWTLRGASAGSGDNGTVLLRCRWLVLSGTLLAHPRCRSLFGWPEVPLHRAAAAIGDPQLRQAAELLAQLNSDASSQLLLTLPAAAAQPWLAMPWRLLQFSSAAQERWGLRRVTIQPLAEGRCAVVAESSPAFAERHRQVYGARSSAATLLAAPADAAAETATLDALQAALEAAIGLACRSADDRQLMRWGAAFPHGTAADSAAAGSGLPPHLQLCTASRIGFCGDAIADGDAGPGFGRVEGALRSAERLAAALIDAWSAA